MKTSIEYFHIFKGLGMKEDDALDLSNQVVKNYSFDTINSELSKIKTDMEILNLKINIGFVIAIPLLIKIAFFGSQFS